jgi:hypothetical protein
MGSRHCLSGPVATGKRTKVMTNVTDEVWPFWSKVSLIMLEILETFDWAVGITLACVLARSTALEIRKLWR